MAYPVFGFSFFFIVGPYSVLLSFLQVQYQRGQETSACEGVLRATLFLDCSGWLFRTIHSREALAPVIQLVPANTHIRMALRVASVFLFLHPAAVFSVPQQTVESFYDKSSDLPELSRCKLGTQGKNRAHLRTIPSILERVRQVGRNCARKIRKYAAPHRCCNPLIVSASCSRNADQES